MRKEIIEKILEEWNVCSCDNSALADRLLEEFSPEGEYIKKEDALKAISDMAYENSVTIREILTELPTYSFPNSAENKGKWIDKTPRYDCGFLPIYTCSECGKSNLWESPYCPSCGADMRGVSE